MNAKSAFANVNLKQDKKFGNQDYPKYCIAVIKLFTKLSDGLDINEYITDSEISNAFGQGKTVGEFVQFALEKVGK